MFQLCFLTHNSWLLRARKIWTHPEWIVFPRTSWFSFNSPPNRDSEGVPDLGHFQENSRSLIAILSQFWYSDLFIWSFIFKMSLRFPKSVDVEKSYGCITKKLIFWDHSVNKRDRKLIREISRGNEIIFMPLLSKLRKKMFSPFESLLNIPKFCTVSENTM